MNKRALTNKAIEVFVLVALIIDKAKDVSAKVYEKCTTGVNHVLESVSNDATNSPADRVINKFLSFDNHMVSKGDGSNLNTSYSIETSKNKVSFLRDADGVYETTCPGLSSVEAERGFYTLREIHIKRSSLRDEESLDRFLEKVSG